MDDYSLKSNCPKMIQYIQYIVSSLSLHPPLPLWFLSIIFQFLTILRIFFQLFHFLHAAVVRTSAQLYSASCVQLGVVNTPLPASWSTPGRFISKQRLYFAGLQLRLTPCPLAISLTYFILQLFWPPYTTTLLLFFFQLFTRFPLLYLPSSPNSCFSTIFSHIYAKYIASIPSFVILT